MIQKIFILGASGNVGKELVKQILEKDNAKFHKNPSVIVGVANSSGYAFNPLGLDKKYLEKLYKNNSREIFSKKYEKLTDLADLVEKAGLDKEVIFVDVTAGKDELLEFHKYVIQNTNNFLVTANKNPISLYSMEDFDILTSYSGRYETNTTVMGGAGILEFINKRVNKIVDHVVKIEGVFSGTLAYILGELNKQEKSFSEIVKFAKNQGYTEPNPWDDLNGLDVARKIVILARYSGYNVSLEDVVVNPLIDEKYGNYDTKELLEKIKQEDAYFKDLVKKAKAENKILAYVAEMKVENNKAKLEVQLKMVDKNSDYGNLSGTLNLAILETEILSSPMEHTIKSRGAGLAVTAASVRIGIAKMLPNDLKSK